MAQIQEKKKAGTVVSFKFTARLGRDENGKRICKCTTWKPPEGIIQKENLIAEEETFRYFAEQVWTPLQAVGGGLRPSTISMYGFMQRVMLPKVGDKRITEIMHQLYNQYHSYAEEARQMGRSASCVRNNILMKNAPKIVRGTFPDAVKRE